MSKPQLRQVTAAERDAFNRFAHNATNHPPTGPHIVAAFEECRDAAIDAAAIIIRMVPEGRERSLALTNLEQALMWARAGIARNQDQVQP